MTDFAIPGLMPEQPEKYQAALPILTLPSHRASDSLWVGIPAIGPLVSEPDDILGEAESAELTFTPMFGCGDPVVFGSSSDMDGQINIDDPVLLYFSVPEQPLPLAPGMWVWSFAFLNSAGNSRTIYSGSILITQ